MSTKFVSSMLEMCALHTQPLARQPTHTLNDADPHCLTLQVTTSTDSAVVVHDIVMTSSSTCYEVDVIYGTQLSDQAQRLYWNERAGRFMPRQVNEPSSKSLSFPESQSYS